MINHGVPNPVRRQAAGLALLILALSLGSLAGCGGPSFSEVSGQVKVDGQPLQEGEIIFEAIDGQTTPAAGKIANGNYALKAIPGKKRVKINASRPTRKPDPVMGSAARESMIAREFNEKTVLTVELLSGKQEGVDFEVKAIP